MEAVSRNQLRELLLLYRHDFLNRTACLSFMKARRLARHLLIGFLIRPRASLL
jgi:hypothetical protein